MKRNVYEQITDRILEQIKNGVLPWQKPWFGSPNGAYNMVTGKPYSILNQILLKHSGPYLTFKQVQDLGGKVKKGSKSETIVYYQILEKEKTLENGTTEKVQIPLIKFYNVFHISQTENLSLKERQKIDFEPLEKAEQLMTEYLTRENIQLLHSTSDQAYYSPSRDLIHLPLKEQFKSNVEYYSTAFHEISHSTLLSTRYNRKHDINHFLHSHKEDYSLEELVAEISCANIMHRLGIETKGTFSNSVSYINGWAKVFRDNIKFIVIASCQAERACKYIFNEQ